MILKEPTSVCKVCFKEYQKKDLYHLLGGANVCLRCLNEFAPKFISFKVGKYKALSIYEYDPKIQGTLYQFKGCYDIELGDVFLDRYKKELRIWFDGYVMVPIPSYHEDDEKRQFNHVEEMFKILKLKMVKAIEKISKVKQANSTTEEREEIYKHLKLIEGVNLKNKKVLLVDDVYTTGNTMAAVVSLIETLKPRKIKILVMSKTSFVPQNT